MLLLPSPKVQADDVAPVDVLVKLTSGPFTLTTKDALGNGQGGAQGVISNSTGVEVEMHPLASVTVTEYVPFGAVIVGVVAPVDHKAERPGSTESVAKLLLYDTLIFGLGAGNAVIVLLAVEAQKPGALTVTV